MTTYDSKCAVERVVDGDTLDLAIDPGFTLTTLQRVRLYGIDTPELAPRTGTPEERVAEHHAALAAKAELEYQVLTAVAEGHQLRVKTERDPDSFGRYLGTLYVEGRLPTLNDTLVNCNLAVRYHGGRDEPRWRDVHLAQYMAEEAPNG